MPQWSAHSRASLQSPTARERNYRTTGEGIVSILTDKRREQCNIIYLLALASKMSTVPARPLGSIERISASTAWRGPWKRYLKSQMT
jgi:hypothetical protein